MAENAKQGTVRKALVLVVDDDIDTVDIIRIKLENHGFSVLAARDGQECISMCQQHNPDLLIVDVMMPKISGFKVVRLLKGNKRFQKTPMIILTARTQEEDKKMSTEVDADLYMTKPFNLDEVLGVVIRLIERKNQSQ